MALAALGAVLGLGVVLLRERWRSRTGRPGGST
jgi:hypothetical protein